MIAVCLGFLVHQPFRLRRDYDFFCIGRDHVYEDRDGTRQHLRQLAAGCYRPVTALLLELVRRYEGRFRCALAFSGTVIEQLRDFAPATLAGFAELAGTGQVELLGAPASHSLAGLLCPDEFHAQVEAQRALLREHFAAAPTAFVNTELIYRDDVACALEALGFQAVLAEGTRQLRGGRSPNFVYQPAATAGPLKLLLRHGGLADGLVRRFAEPDRGRPPPTPARYAAAIQRVARYGEVVNLFFDLETFGGHVPADSGILDFLRALPAAVLARPEFGFATPSQAAARYQPKARLGAPRASSWAPGGRDLTPWRGNPLQDSALQYLYSLREPVLNSGDDELLRVWRHLQSAEHFGYLDTTWSGEGGPRRAPSPFASPHDAYVVYLNVLNDIHERLRRRGRPAPPRPGGPVPAADGEGTP